MLMVMKQDEEISEKIPLIASPYMIENSREMKIDPILPHQPLTSETYYETLFEILRKFVFSSLQQSDVEFTKYACDFLTEFRKRMFTLRTFD